LKGDFEYFIREFKRSYPWVEYVAVVEPDGMVLAGELPEDVSVDDVVSTGSAFLSVASKLSNMLKMGKIMVSVVESADGTIIASSAGDERAVIALTKEKPSLTAMAVKKLALELTR